MFGKVIELPSKIKYLKNIFYHTAVLALFIFIYSCNRKAIPVKNENTTVSSSPVPVKNAAPISAKEYLKKKAMKGDGSPPPVIVVNDKAAGKTIDGKYYYELNGYRYWKNKKDGKYYLNGIFSNNAPKKKSKN